MKENYTYRDSSSEPHFFDRQVTIGSMNRISDLITENHNLKWSYIYMILTVVLSIFIGFFVNSKNYLGILFLLDILLILCIVLGFRYYKKRIELCKIKQDIWDGARKLKIPTC